MERRMFLAPILVILFGLSGAFAQDRNINRKIAVTSNKTTFLIFNSEVDFFDYGSKEVAVEQTDKLNILRLKAATKAMKETNLTVMTKDNQFYSILINYQERPDTLNYFFRSLLAAPIASSANVKEALGNGNSNNENNYVQHAEDIIRKSKKNTSVTGGRQDNVVVMVRGVYTKNDKIFLHLGYFNQSSINFDFDFVKFYIRTKKRMKKASVQDSPIDPIYTYNEELKSLPGQSKEEISQVMVFDKFTIPKDKEFVVDIGESKGERNISFSVPASAFLGAKIF